MSVKNIHVSTCASVRVDRSGDKFEVLGFRYGMITERCTLNDKAAACEQADDLAKSMKLTLPPLELAHAAANRRTYDNASESPVAYAVAMADLDLFETALRLAGSARSLARQMIETAERLERAADASALLGLNTYGEVQARGSEVDRLCALVGEKITVASKMKALAAKL